MCLLAHGLCALPPSICRSIQASLLKVRRLTPCRGSARTRVPAASSVFRSYPGPRLRNEQFRCEITVSKRRLDTIPLKPAVGVVPFTALGGGTTAHSAVKFSE